MINRLAANHRRFLAFLQKRTANREDAEDILQEAFVRAIEKGSALRDEESAVAWFYRLLRNALVDYYRRQGAEGRALAAEQTAPEEPADEELWNEVCGCVTDLLPSVKPEYRELIRAVDLEGASVSDAAKRAGTTANNASVRLHRARQALLRQVQRSCRTCADHGCLDCTCRGPGVRPGRLVRQPFANPAGG